jgi:hypothetical protein
MINSNYSVATLQSKVASAKSRGVEFTLLSSDVASILSAFLAGQISEEDVANWAEFFDGNDDVEFEPGKSIPDVLFELSSPEINGRLEVQRAQELLITLSDR